MADGTISQHATCQDRQADFLCFRKRHPRFSVEKPDLDLDLQHSLLRITLVYVIDGLDRFQHSLTLELSPVSMCRITDFLDRQDRAFFAIIDGLAICEAISYWKLTCSQDFIFDDCRLPSDQLQFWRELFYEGLGEFRYRNRIDISPEEFVDFHFSTQAPLSHFELRSPILQRSKTVLIPIGGGKDSVVSLELLRSSEIERHSFAVNASEAIRNCEDLAEIAPNFRHHLKRRIDPKILEYNQLDYLNGHIPISATLAHLSYLFAYIEGIPYVALSNEASANASYSADLEVNHQWSKSLRFEELFHRYSRDNYGNVVCYFSLLRPFSEYAIAAYFSRYPAYWPVFRSCNLGSKAGRNAWCGACAKCLFVFILLSAFIDYDLLCELFGGDLLTRRDLIDDFRRLTGIVDVRPFECVGEVDEVLKALQVFVKRRPDAHPFLIQVLDRERVSWRQLELKSPLCVHVGADLIPDCFQPQVDQMRRYIDELAKLNEVSSHG